MKSSKSTYDKDMEEEFYATIKLISGEEIICKVCYIPDEEICLVHEPMLVEHVARQQNIQRIDGFTLKQWIHSTFEDLFLLPRENILTMIECDEKVEKFYLKCVSEEKKAKMLSLHVKQGKNGNPEKILPGYVGSVDQTRKILEKIYKGS